MISRRTCKAVRKSSEAIQTMAMKSTPVCKTADTATSVAKRILPSLITLPLETRQQIIEYILTDALHQDIIGGILVNNPRVTRDFPLYSFKSN